MPHAYRARFVYLADGSGALIYGRDGQGLAYRVAPRARRRQEQPVDWDALPEHTVALPAGYATLYAIYPAVAAYQRVAPPELDLALVGSGDEPAVLFVQIPTPTQGACQAPPGRADELGLVLQRGGPVCAGQADRALPEAAFRTQACSSSRRQCR